MVATTGSWRRRNIFQQGPRGCRNRELDSAINDALEQKGRGKTKAKVTRLVRNSKPQVDKAPDRNPRLPAKPSKPQLPATPAPTLHQRQAGQIRAEI